MPRHARVEPSAAATTVTVTVTDDGTVTGTATIAHDRHDPVSWGVATEQALAEAAGDVTGLHEITVVAVPGVVVLDADRRPIWVGHPGDIDAAPDAGWLVKQLPDGVDGWTAAIGRAPRADDAISVLSWLHRSEPEVWARLAHVVSPSGWVLAHLTGRLATWPADLASTGWWSPGEQRVRTDLLAVVDRDRDWTDVLPVPVAADEPAGTWHGAAVVVG